MDPEHDLNGLYDRLNGVERDVSSLVARFDSFEAMLERYARRVDQPTNWVGIGGLVLGAFGVSLTIMTMAVSGVEAKVDAVVEELARRTALVYSAPERLSHLEQHMERGIATDRALIEKVARHEAVLGGRE